MQSLSVPRAYLTRPIAVAALTAALAACAGGPAAEPTTGPTPGPTAAPTPGAAEPMTGLPPIEAVRGPLDLQLRYPPDSAYVATRGRNFIFGSTGNGLASVTINGAAVDVQPNGAFLAFLPVPGDGLYRVTATLNGETATLEVPVVLPPAAGPAGGAAGRGAWIVPGSVYPTGAWVALPGERIEIGVRGAASGLAWLALPDGESIPLREVADAGVAGATEFEVTPGGGEREPDGAAAPVRRVSAYRGFLSARRITTPDSTVAWPRLTGERRPDFPGAAAPGADAGAQTGAGRTGSGGDAYAGAVVYLVVGGDTARAPLPLNLLLADPDRPRVGIGWDPDPPEENGDFHVIARPGPGGGPYHYTWRNGVELELTGERDGAYRVRLADDLSAWTPAADVRLGPTGTPPPASRVATVRLDPQPGYVDVHIALDRRLPYAVRETDRTVSIEVYGAVSRANFLQHGRVDPFVERAEWSQPTDRRFRLDVHLAAAPWGYEAFWGAGDDLVLRLKRPPTIDPGRPLAGLVVGVDAGHGGADRFTVGPTGLTEADANLGIARKLGSLLEERGARVVLSRTTDTTLTLVERTQLARSQDVDLWVSVHNNAFPAGVDPWPNAGTSVYYNHPRAAGLAWSVQRALLDELGLRDLGVGRADLHQARFTWAPSVLTETMFMMIPRQEAFLRTDAGQRRIAEAHLRGIEQWLRGIGREE